MSREALERELAEMVDTDTAVVVSANERTELAVKGVDIAPHRTRMVNEDLDTMG